MNKKMLPIIVAVVVVLAGVGGVYALKRHDNSVKSHNAMMAHESARMHESAMKQSDDAKAQLAIAAKTDTTPPSEAMMHEEAMMAQHGSYLSLADYTKSKASFSDDKKVLFFHASWCPVCQSIDKEITSNSSSIPPKTVIVKADYDSETALKKTFGITQQYTFVQFDNNGNQVKKWSASTLADVLSQIQ
jgi:thioredoxin 1